MSPPNRRSSPSVQGVFERRDSPLVGAMSQPLPPSRFATGSASVAAPVFETLVIVGVGLIGGSIAAAARQRGVVRRVIGVGRRPEKLAGAISSGLLDEATSDLSQAATRADLILFCTPVDRIVQGVRVAGASCRPETILTDAGSTKAQICQELQQAPPQHGEFLGGHPIAGSEKSGYEHANGHLFCGRPCVITPVDSSTERARDLVRRFWEGLGANVSEMSPADHDRALAEISHAPHVIATALAQTLSPENAALVGSGFRDTTRIAAGDADLWTSIVRSNRECLAASLDKFSRELAAFSDALRADDSQRLRELFQHGADRRAALNHQSQTDNGPAAAACDSSFPGPSPV